MQMNLFEKLKQTHRLKRENLMLQEGKGEGKRVEGIDWEFGMDTLLYLKQITNKDLLVWHREMCSILCSNLNGKII